MYAEVDVIVDGAVEDHRIFHDQALLAEFVDVVEADAKADGLVTEVYVTYHDHELVAGECACVQYSPTFGKPQYTFGGQS